MNSEFSEQQIKNILQDPKFEPFIREFLYRRDNKEDTINQLEKNIILVNHISDKDIITSDDINAINHVFIESENLYVLSLLGQLSDENKFDVVLIDPLYGTQSGEFRYNDKIIDEDDPRGMLKWSISIENRLKLAKRLIKPDGVIMVFSNYENCHLLRNCMDKVFGRSNILAQRPWKKKAVPGPRIKGYQDHVDFICVYAVKECSLDNKHFLVPKKGKVLSRYKFDDGETKYDLTPLEKTGSAHALRPTKYDIETPDGSIINPNKQWWRISKKNYTKYDAEGLIIWRWRKKGNRFWKNSFNPSGKKHVSYTQEDLELIKSVGDVEWMPMIKGKLIEEDGIIKQSVPSCIIDENEISHQLEDHKGTLNLDGGNDAAKYIGKKVSSMSPKPVALLKKMLLEVNRKDIRIIDFYGGLASTVQAVIELNQEDGQRRVCYYVQNEEGMDKNCDSRIIDDAHLRMSNFLEHLVKDNSDMFASYTCQNVRYFTTSLIPIDFSKISDGEKYFIFDQSYDLIKMINNSYNIAQKRENYTISISATHMCIVFNSDWDNSEEERQQLFDDIKKCNMPDATKIIYECSTDNKIKSDDICDEVHPLPHETENVQKRAYKLLQ